MVAGAETAAVDQAPDGSGWWVSAPRTAVPLGADGSLVHWDRASGIRRRDQPPVAADELRARYRIRGFLLGIGGRSTCRMDGRSWCCWHADQLSGEPCGAP